MKEFIIIDLEIREFSFNKPHHHSITCRVETSAESIKDAFMNDILCHYKDWEILDFAKRILEERNIKTSELVDE